MRVARLCCIVLLAACGTAHAGRTCDAGAAAPQAISRAAETALAVRAALDERDAPVALVARVGNDLRRHGLVYSHLGFAVRDHAAGRWSIVHLLNHCGSPRSSLFVEGLVNFFADDLARQDARVIWLQDADARALAARLTDGSPHAIHQSRYNLIARPGSSDTQNSTAWALELLASVPLRGSVDRRRAQALAEAEGFRADIVHIPYAQRIAGGLLSRNTVFSDHPLATRLSGEYPVVTVRSILRWLDANGRIAAQREWRANEPLDRPGPA
jgi:hypothetical protein